MKIKKLFLFLLFQNILHFINSLKVNKLDKNKEIKDQYFTKIISNNIDNSILNEDLIDISEYKHINPQDPNYFYLPIFTTSDIHGHFYPEELEIGNISYSKGGLDYVAKYISIIREEFQNRFLYFDAGDCFQGGTESTITNGEIILDYFNLIKANGITLGNHEYDQDRINLEQKLEKAKFPFLASNIYDVIKNTKKAFGKNHFSSKIYSFNIQNKGRNNEIKIGVIGLSIKRLENQISGHGYNGIIFLNYKNELISESNKLRKEKVNAIILLAHIGIECGIEDNLNLNIYKPSDFQESCQNDSELYTLINSIDEGIIDAVITGHSHKEVHHWIKNIPVISSVNNGLYANILYLAFDKNNNYKLVKNEVRIEGPLPICEKIFKKNKKCEFIKESEMKKYLPLIEYKFHNIKIEKDPILNPIHNKYDKLYKNYSQKISTIIGTENILKVEKNGNCYIGNIIADIQNSVTGAEISIVSYGGLRGELNPGKIPYYKIKDLLPFGSRLCSFYMNGNEIKKMMKIIQRGRKKYYMISGLKQIFSKNKNGEFYLSNIKLFNGIKEIDLISEREYLIAANDYLIKKGGNDFDKILTWYKPRNLNCNYGFDLDITDKYLREQKIIDVRKYMDIKNPRIRFIG